MERPNVPVLVDDIRRSTLESRDKALTIILTRCWPTSNTQNS